VASTWKRIGGFQIRWIASTGTERSSLRRALSTIPLLALAAVPAGGAWAVDPFEIQVYEGDINRPWQPGLELHSNFVASGRGASEFPGEAVPNHTWHNTLEPSLGVLEWWELGAYLQLATAPSRSEAHFGGWKLRTKFVVPQRLTGAFTFGLNVEVGRGVAVLGSKQVDSELRPILAYARGRWFVAVNPILGWTLSGPASAAPELEPCAKLRLDTGRHVGLGVEYYAGLGRVDDLQPLARQEHFVYLVGDLLDGPIELNLGVGHGLTEASDAWTIKVIVGRTF
jgi:hypothetical protein